ncbi:hypothetical protein [Vannielia litorea]|uniref:Uncharacterized protein n=1 Tax=Vannielia litorea TaxID=1217970 RepID=A0A1N6FFN2_9RHOB|nr:hypothetical protein [Vannielia litorea]SIN94014.1 hypothetical protein SAMN05444002_1631 [Vannielia litorea]
MHITDPHPQGCAPRWRPIAGRAALSCAALIFGAALGASSLHLSEGGGMEAVLFGLAFAFFFGIPALLTVQQSLLAPGQTRACLFAGRVLGVAWLAAIAWLVGLYL